MKKIILMISMLLAFGLGSCTARSEIDLAGTSWELVEMSSSAELPAAVTLEFDDDGKQVSGVSGCNHYFGEMHLDGNEISFDQLGMTLMGCDAERMALEQAYFHALSSSSTVSIRESLLIIKVEGGEIIFRRLDQ